MEIDVTIKVLSPIHLSSGRADVTVDAEIVHDALGFPYFPAKRFKGLLYESALEVAEMFRLSGLEGLPPLESIFHRKSEGAVQLIVPNFYVLPAKKYEGFCVQWRYLQTEYPDIFTANEVLKSYTAIRYQTRLEKGVAADGSLHNMRVLDAGTEFFGQITLLHADSDILNLLALAMKNLNVAGMKRNRGFGRISCTATFGDGSTSTTRVEKFFARRA